NRGAHTPGVDNVRWRTDRQKLQAAFNLKRHGYRPRPLRRVYIPKPNGKLRPLTVPTLHDRAMQALYALALAPIAETLADRNSYGFREGRCCADALEQCFKVLARQTSARWVPGRATSGLVSMKSAMKGYSRMSHWTKRCSALGLK